MRFVEKEMPPRSLVKPKTKPEQRDETHKYTARRVSFVRTVAFFMHINSINVFLCAFEMESRLHLIADSAKLNFFHIPAVWSVCLGAVHTDSLPEL